MEAVGARMKNSRSLQNLEAATFDRFRNAVERAEWLGNNVKQRYGSQLDMARGSMNTWMRRDVDRGYGGARIIMEYRI